MSLENNYIYKALDAYPYELEETIEALNYALSYDENNIEALCLMGRVNAEVLRDYETAKQYFKDALNVNVNALQVFPHYINVLLWNEDLEEAKIFIKFALKVKGSDKGLLYLKQAVLFEMQQKYKKALQAILLAKNNNYNDEFSFSINAVKDRIKSKMPKKKKNKKNKKSKEK